MKPEDALHDPDFHALSDIERLKVLYKIDPDYRKLHPRERWKVTQMIPSPPKNPPTMAPTPPPQGVSG